MIFNKRNYNYRVVKFLLYYLFVILLIWISTSCSIFEDDDSDSNDNILRFLKINNKYCAIDIEKNEILFPLTNQFYSNQNKEKDGKDFTAQIEFSLLEKRRYELYIDNNIVNNGDVITFEGISILDTVPISISEIIDFKSNTTSNNNKFSNENLESYNLIFTGLPIIMLNSSSIVMKNEKTPAVFILNDPSSNSDINKIQSIGLKIRGAASARYEKKSYSVEFREDDNWNENKNVSLLGMRDDDDWILDAVYIDRTLMRNRVSHDLFLNIFNLKDSFITMNKNQLNWTVRGKFVELFLNNKYHGVYVLSERVDKKQLNLSDENDSYLFKAIERVENPLKQYIIKHPKRTPSNHGVIQETWSSFIEILDFIYNSSDDDFFENIYDIFNIDNVINYQIMILLTSVSDNIEKNFFITKKEVDSNIEIPYKHFFIPWDLDSSFGRHWNGSKYSEFSFRKNFLTDRLFDDEVFTSSFKNRWTELREDILSRDNIISIFDGYYNLLLESGAFERNIKRWPITDEDYPYDDDNYAEDYQYLMYWLNNRLNWLDNRISNL